jgi:lipoate-protein ligase A
VISAPTRLAPDRNAAPAWHILTTLPMSGAENMAYDLNTLRLMQTEDHSPLLRFYRWDKPTVSYGKHQSLAIIQALIPPGWEAVQRPTGGGLVYHGDDLCLSLCWRSGQPPLPERLKDYYAWIHTVILDALKPLTNLPTGQAGTRLANCRDGASPESAFATRNCFYEPVAYDVLLDRQKIVGGALCRHKDAFLYQGSIQSISSPLLETHLYETFSKVLQLS